MNTPVSPFRRSAPQLLVTSLCLSALLTFPANARQDTPTTPRPTTPTSPKTTTVDTKPITPQPVPPLPKIDAERVTRSITKGVELLLSMQEAREGGPKAEWPYEGVYRVGSAIPIGYRVGGTGISVLALLQAPAYKDDAPRQEAVKRSVQFILDSTSHELMNPDYDSSYDTRGWGYTYGLLALLKLKAVDAVDAQQAAGVEKTILWCIDCIQQTDIPKVGGWNYARPGLKSGVSPMSPFMTGPTLQALFQARSQGYKVDDAVVDRAVASLLRARTPTGSYTYGGDAKENPEPIAGAVGRMLVSEVTLNLCGKSDLMRIRAAVDAFFVHWEWLDRRRAQNGTHIPPYNIAPYYFYYAHFYAAQAIEYLPKKDQEEYRRRLSELLWKNQLDDGSWNDRVFPRSRNYGTAMSMMALMMHETPKPAEWKPVSPDVPKPTR